MKTQAPNTFHVNTKTPSAQPTRQYRPNLPADTPVQIRQAFRQAFDLADGLRNSFSPLSLFTKGDGTGTDITIPTETSATELGTSLDLQLTLSRPGNWLISASVNMQFTGDSGHLFTISLILGQSPESHSAQVKPSADQIQMVQQSWQVTSVSGDEICRLYVKKDGGAGTSKVVRKNSTFTATWQGA